jgi:hypothetical protein
MKLLTTDIQIAPSGGFKGFGPLGENQGASSINTLTSIISTAVGVMTIVAIIWFIFTFITGAIGIIGSGGDKQALESARKKITTGLIGLVVVIAALFILDLIGTLFGIKFLDINTLFGQIVSFQQ